MLAWEMENGKTRLNQHETGRRKKMMVCRRSQYTLRRQRRDTMVHRALSLEKNKITYMPQGSDDDAMAKMRQLRLDHEAKIGERKPFSPMVGGKDARGGPGKVYAEDEKCLPRKPDPNEGKSRKQIMYDAKLSDKKPFYSWKSI